MVCVGRCFNPLSDVRWHAVEDAHQLFNASRYVTVEVSGKDLCRALDVSSLPLHRGEQTIQCEAEEMNEPTHMLVGVVNSKL